jgi:hypothetical protein
MAFLASISCWKNGKLSFDAPRTPLHALGRVLMGYVLERSHDYEPEARVYTYTPATIKGLWRQRVRWNSSRVECAGRFWRSFWFHWEIGLPTGSHLLLVLHNVFEIGIYYVVLPYMCFKSSHAALGYVLGYVGQTLAYSLYTLMALAIEKEWRKYWRVVLCLPFAAPYAVAINFFGCIWGVTRDVFGFGNWTNFAPEWTLIKGGTARIAILFRVRRFLALCVRAVIYGDVPFGAFWFGWRETPWTPNGFTGWTTGKKPPPIVPRRGSRRPRPQSGDGHAAGRVEPRGTRSSNVAETLSVRTPGGPSNAKASSDSVPSHTRAPSARTRRSLPSISARSVCSSPGAIAGGGCDALGRKLM